MQVARFAVLSVLFSLMWGAVSFGAETFSIDPVHSSVLFRIKHANIGHFYGRFNTVGGTIVFDEADASKSTVEFELKAESVDTNNEKRDQHVKGPDFFNAKQFPAITFKSKAVKKAGDVYEVTGDLTLLGVTKEVTAKMAYTGGGKTPFGDFRVGFDGTFSIKRSDFGMSKMVDMLSDEIMLIIAVEGAHK